MGARGRGLAVALVSKVRDRLLRPAVVLQDARSFGPRVQMASTDITSAETATRARSPCPPAAHAAPTGSSPTSPTAACPLACSPTHALSATQRAQAAPARSPLSPINGLQPAVGSKRSFSRAFGFTGTAAGMTSGGQASASGSTSLAQHADGAPQHRLLRSAAAPPFSAASESPPSMATAMVSVGAPALAAVTQAIEDGDGSVPSAVATDARNVLDVPDAGASAAQTPSPPGPRLSRSPCALAERTAAVASCSARRMAAAACVRGAEGYAGGEQRGADGLSQFGRDHARQQQLLRPPLGCALQRGTEVLGV